MIVPYRDPSFDHYRRTAYDIGEWGLGYMTTSLALGCDCLGEIRYRGRRSDRQPRRAVRPSRTPSACTRRTTPSCGSTSTGERPAPRCAGRAGSWSPCHATVANYEYLVYWRFYQDGNIECEVRATGIMVTTPFAGGPSRRRTGPSSTSAPTPRSTSTSWSRGSTSTSTARPTRSSRSTRWPRRSDRTTPTDLGLTTRGDTGRLGERGRAGLQLGHPAGAGRSSTPTSSTAYGTPVGYKLVPAAAFPVMMDPSRRSSCGRRSWATSSG